MKVPTTYRLLKRNYLSMTVGGPLHTYLLPLSSIEWRLHRMAEPTLTEAQVPPQVARESRLPKYPKTYVYVTPTLTCAVTVNRTSTHEEFKATAQIERRF